jgi:hypothetical protein
MKDRHLKAIDDAVETVATWPEWKRSPRIFPTLKFDNYSATFRRATGGQMSRVACEDCEAKFERIREVFEGDFEGWAGSPGEGVDVMYENYADGLHVCGKRGMRKLLSAGRGRRADG